MKTVAIIYRDNDLFAKWMSFVKMFIETLGYAVEMKVFAKETDSEAIKQWILENYKEFLGKIVMNDGTCSFYAVTKESEYKEVKNGISGKDIIDLDRTFEQANFRSIFGASFSSVTIENKWQKCKFELKEGDYDEKFESALAPTKKSLEILLSSIAKKKLPKKVFISTTYLLSHGPFESLKQNWKGSPEEAYVFAAKIVQEIFSIIGCEIEIMDKSDWNTIKTIDKKGNWVIVDRHYKTSVNNAVKLQLPIGNFYEDLRKYGLIKVSDKKLQKVLETTIKKVLRGGD